MLTREREAAMQRAHEEILEESGGYDGAIPPLPGVWATGATLPACRDALREALAAWVVLGLRLGHEVPEPRGVRLEGPVAA